MICKQIILKNKWVNEHSFILICWPPEPQQNIKFVFAKFSNQKEGFSKHDFKTFANFRPHSTEDFLR